MNNASSTTMTVDGGLMTHYKSKIGLRLAGTVALALLLAACKTGPDYTRPAMDIKEGFKSATETESAQPNLARDWWQLFNDPELSSLVEQALAQNLDLKAAMARVAQSRASAKSVRGSFYPVLTMDPSAKRARTPGADSSSDSSDTKITQATTTINKITSLLSQMNALRQGNTSGTGSGGSAQGASSASSTSSMSISGGGATTSNSFQIPFDLNYEVDIWGRVRRSYESSKAQLQASLYDVEVVRQTLLADLVRNYFNLRSFDAQYEILLRNLNLYQEQVELTGNQYKAGLISETDLLQAQVQLESTRAQAADTLRQRTDLEHAIAILLGRAPVQFSLPVRPLNATPPLIPAGLPSDLLRRRPDVAEAEQNLISACAEIGVAKAEFFPVVKLTGSAGFQNDELKNIFDWENFAWSIGPSISLPIFQGGQLWFNLKKAKARYEELDATYRAQVLSAFVDVEDSLTDLHMRADAADAQSKAVIAAREYLRLIQIEYQSGITDYMHVVNAEQTLLSNELTEAQILNQRMVSTVLLIKALGGGWDSQPAPVVKQEKLPGASEESADRA